MTLSAPRSPERAFALQKYLLLHGQHDALQKHLVQIRSSSSSPSSSPDSRKSSLSNIPIMSRNSSSAHPNNSPFPDAPHDVMAHSPTPSHQRRSSVSLSQKQRPRILRKVSSFPIEGKEDAESSDDEVRVDDERLEEMAEEESKLKDVNLQIKSTLMELLACERVRGSEGNMGRMWVQSRLMEVEREIRGGRKASLGCAV